ncbi:MAG TPA: galactokinase [Solirubrobacteraceae bacterium]
MRKRVTAFGPGRVNLIGEHTDYNDGLALPFAISDGVTVGAVRREDHRISVTATDLDAEDCFAIDSEPEAIQGWRGFARGIAAELRRAGVELPGAELEITGTVPRGSGLSSSAALEVALCLAMLALGEADRRPDRIELAKLCSRVENEWVGAHTGLLDQLASLCGEPGVALLIDFQSLQVSEVKLELGDYSLVTLDSGQRHANAPRSGGSDATDGYNRRREECARAAELLGVASLRDATADAARRLPAPLGARVGHVISENIRVQDTAAALSAGDLPRVGELLNASHASLRDDYEISTPAVEATVQRLLDAGAIGARIVGGGFGGHVLGLLAPGARAPEDAIEVRPGPGASLIDDAPQSG